MMRLISCVALLLALAAPAWSAQTATVRYQLEEVWLLPDVTHPGAPPRQMTGEFHWTYVVGDFENGSGSFDWVDIPWFGSDLNKMVITIDLSSIEISLNGNYHGLGLDVTLHLLEDLAPNQPVDVDLVRSQFHVEQGISYMGHVQRGTIGVQPQLILAWTGPCTQPTFSIDGGTTLGPVALLWARQSGNFVIPNGNPCAGLELGLDASVQIGTILTSDAAGQTHWTTVLPPAACGLIWLQAIDPSTCGLSEAELFQ